MDTFKIKFTPAKLAALKAELAKHTNDEDVFDFEGHPILVAYGRYLAEYLTGTFMAMELKGQPAEYEATD